MKCPKCTHQDTKVVESRDAGDGDSIRRRRECLSCGYRYTTYERIERPNLAIVKKSGERELFDRRKLSAAILRSVGKFLRSDLEVEEVVSFVEDELYAIGDSEVPSKMVGDLVLKELGRRNAIAYVRFASVYRGFSSLDEFEQAIAEARAGTTKS
jgi:transcriptional repressor NrdR